MRKYKPLAIQAFHIIEVFAQYYRFEPHILALIDIVWYLFCPFYTKFVLSPKRQR